MAEGDIRRAVQNRRSGLIEHGSRRLLHVARRLILSASVGVAALHPADVEPLRGAGLGPHEVVPLQKDGIKDWMIGVYACVNDGDDSLAGYAKPVLSVLKTDDLRCRLRGVTVPHDHAVIIHRCLVVKPRSNALEAGQRDLQQWIHLDTSTSEQGLRW